MSLDNVFKMGETVSSLVKDEGRSVTAYVNGFADASQGQYGLFHAWTIYSMTEQTAPLSTRTN